MKAFVLVNVRAGKSPEVLAALRHIDAVRIAHACWGRPDIFALVEVRNERALGAGVRGSRFLERDNSLSNEGYYWLWMRLRLAVIGLVVRLSDEGVYEMLFASCGHQALVFRRLPDTCHTRRVQTPTITLTTTKMHSITATTDRGSSLLSSQ